MELPAGRAALPLASRFFMLDEDHRGACGPRLGRLAVEKGGHLVDAIGARFVEEVGLHVDDDEGTAHLIPPLRWKTA